MKAKIPTLVKILAVLCLLVAMIGAVPVVLNVRSEGIVQRVDANWSMRFLVPDCPDVTPLAGEKEEFVRALKGTSSSYNPVTIIGGWGRHRTSRGYWSSGARIAYCDRYDANGRWLGERLIVFQDGDVITCTDGRSWSVRHVDRPLIEPASSSGETR